MILVVKCKINYEIEEVGKKYSEDNEYKVYLSIIKDNLNENSLIPVIRS